ncbi:MAG: glutathione S-transferase C-terminal domain-containing protein [Myxococcota bacterium]
MSDPVVVYMAPRAWGIPNPSPFVVKLETWLRMAEVPYLPKLGNPLRSPRGKVPWIEWRGETLADSQRIIERLSRDVRDLDAHLGPADRARGHLVRRTLEEATYFLTFYDRWMIPENYEKVHDAFFRRMGPPGRVVGWAVRRTVRRNLWGQGVARYTAEERADMARADIDAIAAQLGDGPYVFGDRPTTVDAALYGFLCQLLYAPFDGPAQLHARANPRLVAYGAGIRERHWREIPPLQ